MTLTPETADEGLRADIRGDVLQPVDSGFDQACQGFNLALRHRPSLVVHAAHSEDVATAVRFAARTGLPVRAHSTGHGIGTPAESGVLIATNRLREVSIDPVARTARASAGSRWSDVISAAAPHGLMPLCGSSPTVGVVGYTLGGGMGPVGRTYGFASDRVRSARIVTAEGNVIEVDEDREPELFWGLRGGKLDVGIVTELEFELIEMTSYFGGGIFYDQESVEPVMHEFVEWAQTLPVEATSSIALLRLPDMPGVPEPLRGRTAAHLRFVHTGNTEDGKLLIEPMRRIAPAIFDLVESHGTATIGSVHQDPQEPMPARDDSILLHSLPIAAIDAILDVAGPDSKVPLNVVEIRHLGGALAADTTAPSAVSGRDGAFNLMVVGAYPPPLTEAVDRACNHVLSAVTPWSMGRRQANFQGWADRAEHFGTAWAPPIRSRLDDLKSTWDPSDRFR